MCVSRVVFELRQKDEISEKKKLVAMATSLENSKIEVRFRSSSTAIAEPNGENRVKIRPVEGEIIGLTEIVKNNKIQKQNIWLPGSHLRRHRVAKQAAEKFAENIGHDSIVDVCFRVLFYA